MCILSLYDLLKYTYVYNKTFVVGHRVIKNYEYTYVHNVHKFSDVSELWLLI